LPFSRMLWLLSVGRTLTVFCLFHSCSFFCARLNLLAPWTLSDFSDVLFPQSFDCACSFIESALPLSLHVFSTAVSPPHFPFLRLSVRTAEATNLRSPFFWTAFFSSPLFSFFGSFLARPLRPIVVAKGRILKVLSKDCASSDCLVLTNHLGKWTV